MKNLFLYIIVFSLLLFFNNTFSQDGPNVWTLTYNNQGRIYAMVIDPANQNIIYEAGLDSGIYKTTNAGLNWFPVNNGLTYNKVQCLSISLSNPLVLYAGTDQNGAANSGVYKTTDGGSNWVLVSNGITDSKGIQSIAIHPTNPNTAWAAVFDGVVPSTVGVFKTTDGGANWSASSNGIDIKNILTVIVNPLNGNCLYAGSSFYTASPGSTKIYKSFDGGANWTSFSSGLPSGATTGNPVRNMSMSTIDTSVVLATLFCNDTTGGAYLTTNAGVNWTKKHGLPNIAGTLLRAGIIKPGTTNEFFVGLDGGGATTRGVWRSTDAGATWADFNGGAMLNTFTIRALVFKTTGDPTLFAGAATASPATSRGVYEYSWPLPPPPLCEQFTSTTFPPTNWTIAGTPPLYWVRSTVSGFGIGVGSAKYDMWNAPSGTNQSLITHTFTATSSPQLIIDMAYSVYLTAQDSLIINTSTNGGTTWTSLVRLGPSQLSTTAPQTSEFTPTAGQWAKRFYSLPAQTNKIEFLGKSQFGNNLYLDSICVRDITAIIPIGIVAGEYSLSQNYPNPFNPNTTITYNLPVAGNVKLVVFDILGREVATLVNGNVKAGMHDVVFDAANISSGVYFYKIEAGDFIDTKKMVLIK